MWLPLQKKNSRIIALHCVWRQAVCTSHASQRSQAKSNDADAKDDNQSSHLRGHLRLLHEGPIIKHFNAETSQPWPWNMMQNIAMINKTVGNVAVILFWVTRREPMFWLQTTRSLASLDRLWVAANVKYLDLAEPAYVENQRANDIRGKQTWRATFHHASTRHTLGYCQGTLVDHYRPLNGGLESFPLSLHVFFVNVFWPLGLDWDERSEMVHHEPYLTHLVPAILDRHACWVILEVWVWILEFGFWISNPVLPQGESPPRGTLANFFAAHFWSLFQIFKKQTFMSQTLHVFLWFPLYHSGILLAVLINLQKYICVFLGEARREPAIHVKTPYDCMAVWQEKHGANKAEEKVHCLQGATPVLAQGEGPPRGTLADVFFLTFWDVMGNPMQRKHNNTKEQL